MTNIKFEKYEEKNQNYKLVLTDPTIKNSKKK